MIKSIKTIPIDKLKPQSKNVKIHSKEQIEALAKIISNPKIGFNQPIVIDKKNNIWAGHGRLVAAKKLGMKEVPVVYLGDLTEDEKKAYMIMENRINESPWNKENLEIILDEIKFDFKPYEMSFDDIIPPKLQEELHPIPELPEVPKSKLGDIYQLGNHKVMCGDCTKDLDKLLGDKKVDLLLTDPPYGVNYEKKNIEILKSKTKSNILNDELQNRELESFFDNVFTSISKFLRKGTSYYVCAPQGGLQMMMMMMMMNKAGIPMKHELIWIKPSPVFSMGRLDYDYQHEPILYGWIGTHEFIGKGNLKKSVWAINRDSDKSHPTMKPVELMINAILNSSRESTLILDPFLGSGSTLIACEQTNRICYGMEIDPHYVDVIVKRWENFTGKKAKLLP